MENVYKNLSKIELIQQNVESAIAALTLYLDGIYNMTDEFFDSSVNEDGQVIRTLKENLQKDEKTESFILDLNKDAEAFEKVRTKLQNKDFELSTIELARIGLGFLYVKVYNEKQIKTLSLLKEDIDNILEVLMKDTNNIQMNND